MGKITDERQLYILEHCNKFRKDFQRKGHVNKFFRLHFIPKTAKLADLGRWAGPRRRCFLPGGAPALKSATSLAPKQAVNPWEPRAPRGRILYELH